MNIAHSSLVSLVILAGTSAVAWCTGDVPAFEAELISEVSLTPSGVPISNIAVSGSKLALSTGIARAQHYNMSEPEFPDFLGYMNIGGHFELLTDLAWHGGHVFVSVGMVGTHGVRIFDGSDPLASEPIGFIELDMVVRMAFDGPYMYSMGRPYSGDIHQLQITDIADPSSPVLLSSSLFAATYENTNLGGIEVNEGYVYLACGPYGLLVWDATTPESPVLVGGYATQASFEDVAVFEPFPGFGAILAVANGADGLLLLNASQPDSPDFVASYPIDDLGGEMISVQVHGDLCYAVVDGVGLVVLDISNAFDIQQVGLIPQINGAMTDFAIEGDLLYVIEYGLLRVFDLAPAGDPGCQNPADINGDGLLNFYDVSAFLIAYSNGDLVADITEDGFLNFHDVLAFMQSYNAGCP